MISSRITVTTKAETAATETISLVWVRQLASASSVVVVTTITIGSSVSACDATNRSCPSIGLVSRAVVSSSNIACCWSGPSRKLRPIMPSA